MKVNCVAPGIFEIEGKNQFKYFTDKTQTPYLFKSYGENENEFIYGIWKYESFVLTMSLSFSFYPLDFNCEDCINIEVYKVDNTPDPTLFGVWVGNDVANNEPVYFIAGNNSVGIISSGSVEDSYFRYMFVYPKLSKFINLIF